MKWNTVATRTRTIGFPFLKPGLYSASFFQFASNRSRCGPTRHDLWLLNQELVETILYSMDRQKDGYIRLDDLVAGLRSSTSFSLSLYREEFILVGLMVAGFLLYQVQIFCFWIPIKHMTFQVAKQYGLVPVIGVYDGPIGTWSVNPSKQSEMHTITSFKQSLKASPILQVKNKPQISVTTWFFRRSSSIKGLYGQEIKEKYIFDNSNSKRGWICFFNRPVPIQWHLYTL